jgi:hypothetical protein
MLNFSNLPIDVSALYLIAAPRPVLPSLLPDGVQAGGGLSYPRIQAPGVIL